MNLADYEAMQPHVIVDGMKFFTPNQHCLWRVDTLRTKEPDTIAWIDTFPEDAVFYDVGANVGMYTIYAGHRGITTYAFEPESQNFALLCRNIAFNDFNNVIAYPISLYDKNMVDSLRLSMMHAGASCHTFGEDVDYRGNNHTGSVKQGSISLTLHDFAATTEAPTHIKIDVDGLEHKVIEGIGDFLPRVQSMLIEIDIDRDEHSQIIDFMLNNGFYYDDVQVETARRREGPFQGIGNMIFHRKE